jgi:hypothetical protein
MPLPSELVAAFPGLASGYQQTSEATPLYNCIGHAAGDDDVWWEPIHGYWPRRATKSYSLAALQEALSYVGYSPCASGDLEDGMEKVALFVGSKGEYEHAARQLANGLWTSKIGKNEDISHELHQLEGVEYGRVVAFMRRPRR